MRKTCGCPDVPFHLHLVQKPYGANRLFTEPARVLEEWRQALASGKPGPVFWHSFQAAVCHQRHRSSNPKHSSIDPFAVVSIALPAYPFSLELVEHAAERLHPNDPELTYYTLNEQSFEQLARLLQNPQYNGLSLRLLTAERAEQIYENQWEADHVWLAHRRNAYW